MSKVDITSVAVVEDVEDGSTLQIVLNCPSGFFPVERIVTHPRCSKYYSMEHAKVIALQDSLDTIMGRRNHFKCIFKMKLPKSGLQLTDPRMSGHPSATIV